MGTCSACGEVGREGARFCDSCGRVLPPPDGPRKERKFAALLFADVVGSTSLGEQHDPEIVEELIGRTLERLSQKVAAYGGVVEGHMGDGLLAVFGIPVAHEDDCERAVRAALEMHATVSELNRQPALQHRPDLSIRIGIEAGEVLVGDPDVGGRSRVLTGDAINLAARLQTAAPPGGVVVGPAAKAATDHAVTYEGLEPLVLKGKARPVEAWLAQTIKARMRGERAPLAFGPALVGREREMEILERTLERTEAEGRPALITILGNAGVGKSRLAWELRRYVDEAERTFYWRLGRSQAYGAAPYSAMADVMKAHCEILDDDPPDAVAAKVDRAVRDLFGSNEVTAEVLELMGSEGVEPLSRERLFDAWRRFLERLSARYPLVLVLEDIQWADDGLLDLIEHLADWALGPIFILTLARPELLERRSTWGGGRRNYAAIYLDPMPRAQIEELVARLLDDAVLEEIGRVIASRSEGNPLFAEEIVRMLIDRGTLVKEGDAWTSTGPIDAPAIPRSIHSLISARLDTLTPEEKATLQDAAVVGRHFWLGALSALDGRGSDHLGVIGRLRLKEMVIPREPPRLSGELEFSFKHALIRDVAYESLARRDRARKHSQVAAWARALGAEASERNVELIATHYDLALRDLEALDDEGAARRELEREVFRWALQAGQRAYHLWLHREAARWYRRAIDLFERAGTPEETKAQVLDAYALATLGTETYEEAARSHEAALAAYEGLGSAADAGRVEARLAQIAFESSRDDVIPRIERALERLEPLGTSAALASVLHVLGWYHWRRGNYDIAEPPLRRATTIARDIDEQVVLGQALQTLGVMLVDRGEWSEGLRLMEDSYEVARKAGNLDLLLRACHNLPNVLAHYAPGYDEVRAQTGMERASQILAEGLELARRAGNRRWESGILGITAWTLKNAGELEAARRSAEESLASARAIGSDSLIGEHLLDVALIEIDRGSPERAERPFVEASDILAKHPEPGNSVWVAVAGAAIERGKGNDEAAVAILLQTLDELGENLPVYGGEWLVHDAIRALRDTGRVDEAHNLLAKKEHLFKGRPISEAALAWSAGLILSERDRAIERLREAAEAFDSYGWRVSRARCLIDLGDRIGSDDPDGAALVRQGRALLAECGVVGGTR